MRLFCLVLFFALSACSREQTNVAVATVAKSYNESYRDNVIKNHQAKVANTPACAEIKAKFETVGKRYDNAANGAFANDMIKLWEATKVANCVAPL